MNLCVWRGGVVVCGGYGGVVGLFGARCTGGS
jgi:hypothetical protein